MKFDEWEFSGVLLDDVRRLVFGRVIEYKDFEGRVVRFCQGIEGVSDARFLVASWDQDTYGDIPGEGECIGFERSGLEELKVSRDHRAGE